MLKVFSQMSREGVLSRSVTFLLASIALIALLAACGTPAAEGPAAAEPDSSSEEAADTAEGDAAAADAGDGKEAPQLAEMVAAGDLPPLEERLPVNPVVVEPVESVGQYGGIWRSGLRGGSDNAWIFRTIANEHLTRWERDWTGVRPNVAESWEINDDSTEYSSGMRMY